MSAASSSSSSWSTAAWTTEGVPEWVGDRYVVWEEGDGTCVRIAYVGDLDELEDALATWEDRTGGRIERVDDTVTVTGCTI